MIYHVISHTIDSISRSTVFWPFIQRCLVPLPQFLHFAFSKPSIDSVLDLPMKPQLVTPTAKALKLKPCACGAVLSIEIIYAAVASWRHWQRANPSVATLYPLDVATEPLICSAHIDADDKARCHVHATCIRYRVIISGVIASWKNRSPHPRFWRSFAAFPQLGAALIKLHCRRGLARQEGV